MERDKAQRAEYMRDYYQQRRSDPAWVEAKKNASMAYRVTKTTSAGRMLVSARSRAKKKGLPFNLEVTDIVIPEVCPLLGIPIVEGHLKGKKGPSSGSPSLDRIRPELGYVRGNVWVISHRANVIKQDATPDELDLIASQLRKRLAVD